jgi:hypothetical protein
MLEEITVFEIPEEEVTVNKSQKQLEYEELEKKSKLNKHHFSTLYEMEELVEKKQRPKSSLISIMLKWVLQFCMPILPTDDKSEEYSISLQNETYIYGIRNNKYISIPSGQQYKIIGIRLPPIFIRFYNRYMLSQQDYISDNQLIQSGHYGLFDFQTLKFTQQRGSFVHPGIPTIAFETAETKDSYEQSRNIIFKDDESTSKILDQLLDYIDYTEKYYSVNFPVIKYDMFGKELEGEPMEKWYVVNGHVVENPKTAKNEPDLLFQNFSDKMLEMLNSVQRSNFGNSFYYDIMYMLEKNKLIHVYNLGNKIGIDNSSFKKEFAERKEQIEYQEAFEKQVQEGFNNQLVLTKRKNIAFEKYGIYDLAKLDSKQKSVVDLEFKKLENISNETGLSVRKLFFKLQKSFGDAEPENIHKILVEIEKVIKATDLNSTKLLEGGVCPHTYHYGKKLYENFGKPWVGNTLRDLMINDFALPVDTQGYFCKICGEKIGEPDNTSVMRFFGERSNNEEDPVQIMIWKEAMYIISSNVRFLTPIPIKPLVSSLASGLRNVIVEEESKLYRSKTNTGESIKDMLNLYAAIYIYAALCALMISNPGKMMFARDKPENNERPRNKPKSEFFDKSKDSAIKLEDDTDADKADDADDESNEPKSEFLEESNIKTAAGNVRRKRKYRYVKGGRVVTDIKVAEKFYLNTALKLILLTKETIISRLRNFNVDLIKQIFLKTAYTWAVKHAKPIKVGNEVQLTRQNFIVIEPFYTYTYYMKRLGHNHGTDKFAANKFDDIKGVLGRDEEKITKDMSVDINIYETVRAPSQWHMKKSSLSKDTEFTKLYDTYTYLSYMSYLEYQQQKIYQKSFIPRHVQVVEYFDKYANIKDLERQVYYRVAVNNVRSILEIKLNNDLVSKYNNFAPNRLDLAQHYCSSGELHKAGSFIYTDGKKEIEITKKDIVDWLKDNNEEKLATFAKLKLINERCSKCKNTIRDASSNTKSDKSLVTMFKALDDILAFYQYYETRCPKGNLHDIVDNVCSVCQFNTEFKKTKDAEYYKKYVSQFNKIQNEKQSLSIKSLEIIKDENIAVHDPHTEKTTEVFQYSLKKTAEWSQVSETKYNILVNIGLYEGHKYSDIETSKVNPSKSDDRPFLRALKLKGYIHWALRDYSYILNHENTTDMRLELRDIIDAQKKIDITNLHNSMPVIIDFEQLDKKMKFSLSITDYVNFLQEYLASFVLRIMSDSSEKYKTMAKLLVKYFTSGIIEQEKLMSKPAPIINKIDITTGENGSEDESGVSGDDWAGHNSDKSESEFEEENAVETYDNDLDQEGFDVEDAGAIWENE